MPGDWLFKAVPAFIIVVFVLAFVALLSYGYLIYKGASALQGCVPAIVSETKDGKTSTSIGCKK